ncbi:MAG: PLxRFG domain-containing protein [Rhodoblastus sp.]|nr:MAG: PLxRFG domain-containing protein [Rhodoblastus sp.]
MVKDAHGWFNEATPAERKAAQGRFLSSLAITGMMAGLRGAYMASYIIPALAGAAGLLGLYDKDKDEPQEWLRRTILNNMPDTMMGRAVGGMLMDGVPGYLTGVNLSDRIGVPDIGYRNPEHEMSAEKLWEYLIEQAGGPALDVGKKLFTGAADVARGEVQRGAEKMLPAAFRNVSKAIRYAQEGVTDKAGDDIVDKVAPQDIAKQVIGLNPAEIADRRARNNFQRNVQTKMAEKRRETLHVMTHAIESHDAGKMANAREELRRFNAKFPEKAITARSILDSVKATNRRSNRKEFGVLLDLKLARGIKANTSPSIYAREEND